MTDDEAFRRAVGKRIRVWRVLNDQTQDDLARTAGVIAASSLWASACRWVTFDERLDEIQSRYGPDHLVSRSMQMAAPGIRRAITEMDLLRNRPR